MNFNKYAESAVRTMNPELTREERVLNCLIGIPGETGELLEHFKKMYFHGHELDRDYVEKELGDILWYMANLCVELNIEFNNVAKRNIAKLRKRYPEKFTSEQSRNRKE